MSFSVDSLEQMRRFYLVYREKLPVPGKTEEASRISHPQISETVSRILTSGPAEPDPLTQIPLEQSETQQTLSAELAKGLTLGWSHYVAMR